MWPTIWSGHGHVKNNGYIQLFQVLNNMRCICDKKCKQITESSGLPGKLNGQFNHCFKTNLIGI